MLTSGPIMASPVVELRVAGHVFKVTSSADPDELKDLAREVDARVTRLVPKGKTIPQNAVLLAAIALVHELRAEKASRVELEKKTRDVLRRALSRIDRALEEGAEA
jgi:cell division protein ZapA (FtsZ GTPase activity inhibitor)